MSIIKSGRFAWLPWAASWFFGGMTGWLGWSLTAWARAYCDAGYEAGGRLELNILLLVVPVLGGLTGLTALATGRLLTQRAPTAVRTCVPTLLVVTTTALFAWSLFATHGTLDNYPGDSGRCPASNIPPQWPDWLPA
jgi:hypothetical protein